MFVIGLGHQLVDETGKLHGWHYITTNGREEIGTCKSELCSVEHYFGTAEKPGTLVTALKDCISGDLSKKPGLKIISVANRGNNFQKTLAEKLFPIFDRKVLETESGECIELPSDVRIVIEMQGPNTPYPALYSRAPLINWSLEE